MGSSANERWWEIRRAQNRKPATYTCPLCRGYLPALSEHMLLFPEGDRSRRRHAHAECVMRARSQGRLPTRDEFLRSEKKTGPSRDRIAVPPEHESDDASAAGTPLARLRAMLGSLRR